MPNNEAQVIDDVDWAADVATMTAIVQRRLDAWARRNPADTARLGGELMAAGLAQPVVFVGFNALRVIIDVCPADPRFATYRVFDSGASATAASAVALN